MSFKEDLEAFKEGIITRNVQQKAEILDGILQQAALNNYVEEEFKRNEYTHFLLSIGSLLSRSMLEKEKNA